MMVRWTSGERQVNVRWISIWAWLCWTWNLYDLRWKLIWYLIQDILCKLLLLTNKLIMIVDTISDLWYPVRTTFPHQYIYNDSWKIIWFKIPCVNCFSSPINWYSIFDIYSPSKVTCKITTSKSTIAFTLVSFHPHHLWHRSGLWRLETSRLVFRQAWERFWSCLNG